MRRAWITLAALTIACWSLAAVAPAMGAARPEPAVWQSVTKAGGEEDRQLVIAITGTLLRINQKVLLDLPRFVPASQASTITAARHHLARLSRKLRTRPDAVLSATQDAQLESVLVNVGPGDPFASLPFLSEEDLKPGDVLLQCSTALSSQLFELMMWSRYTHAALYIGDGMIIDSTWKDGVKTRGLDDLLDGSNRVGVVRLRGLPAEQAAAVVAAARSKKSSEYDFEGVKVLGEQKLDLLSAAPHRSLGEMIGILGRAEYLPQTGTEGKKFACSELIVSAYKAAGITLSEADGFTAGDIVRLSQAGFFSEVGRLRVSAD